MVVVADVGGVVGEERGRWWWSKMEVVVTDDGMVIN
jgi:hypothetical protein